MPQDLYASVLKTTALSEVNQAKVTVRGKITDDAGSSLPGVNILEKGTTNGTVSDSDGAFTLTVASGESVLVVSFIGTVTQEIRVGDQTNIDVQLVTDAKTLSEVVVIGYGTQEKKDITGAVSSLKSEEFNKG
ncbi:MAG: hypothetical protein C0490_13905, partial [Marivirga sp.]|nr:hypothetical protein [Marivirga sp.]